MFAAEQRLTPVKFSMPHVHAVFGPGGQLVHVLPNSPKNGQTAIVTLQDLGPLIEYTRDAEELNAFPGPLVK